MNITELILADWRFSISDRGATTVGEVKNGEGIAVLLETPRDAEILLTIANEMAGVPFMVRIDDDIRYQGAVHVRIRNVQTGRQNTVATLELFGEHAPFAIA